MLLLQQDHFLKKSLSGDKRAAGRATGDFSDKFCDGEEKVEVPER